MNNSHNNNREWELMLDNDVLIVAYIHVPIKSNIQCTSVN
jgi:hypothetical protein